MTFIVLLVQLGRTLLHNAAHNGSRDVVDLLLAFKADADAVDKVGVVTIKYCMLHVGMCCMLYTVLV